MCEHISKLNTIIYLFNAQFSVSKSHQTHQFHANRVEIRCEFCIGKNNNYWKYTSIWCDWLLFFFFFFVYSTTNKITSKVIRKNVHISLFMVFFFFSFKSTFWSHWAFVEDSLCVIAFSSFRQTKGAEHQSHQETID